MNPPSPLAADTFHEIFPGVYRWEIFSPEHKVELTSHAIVTDGKLFCFDPIPLATAAFERLASLGKPEAIILTNGNHERDAQAWRAHWRTPIWASPDAELSMEDMKRFDPAQTEWNGFRVHSVSGGGAGELAFRFRAASLLLFGDAVVNLPSRQLELLPAKYCRDPETVRTNLRRLLAEPFANMAMAHGTPVKGGASDKLRELLGN